MSDVKAILKKYWFLIGILVVIALALIVPGIGAVDGILFPDITARYFAVWIIFFISGVTIRKEDFASCYHNLQLNAFIQVTAFLFFPIFVKIVLALLTVFEIDEWIVKGMTVLSCMPPPVSTAVILTRAVGGNEAAAIFNSVLGSLLGVILTPFSLIFFLGTTTLIPVMETVWSLVCQVVLPIVIGQLVRRYTEFDPERYPTSTIGQSALLFIIYITFCQTFLNQDVDICASTIIVTVILVVLIQILAMVIVFQAASRIEEFSEGDVIAALFCSTQKSLTLGIPMLRIMYHGYSHLTLISLPLLMYHPSQVILGSLLVTSLQDWVRKRRRDASRSRLTA